MRTIMIDLGEELKQGRELLGLNLDLVLKEPSKTDEQ